MLGNAILVAVREIRRSALRSLLTMLGIVIGVAAVIVMVTIGSGATVMVTDEIEKLGGNLLIVAPGQRPGPGRAAVSAAALEWADAQAIANQIPSATVVVPAASRSAVVIHGGENWNSTITGTVNEYLGARNWSLHEGRAFTEGELRSGKAVCIIGDTVREQLFGRRTAVDARVRVGRLSCQVVGVLAPKGQSMIGLDQDDLVLVPLRMFQRRIAGNQDVASIYVAVGPEVSTEPVLQEITALMHERRRIAAGEDNDFFVMDMEEVARTVAGAAQIMTALLGAVAAVSLLVGGVGIMNIMLVSVAQRTREIGIRLSIGALQRDILVQFLVEAVVISSLGGLLGIAVGLMGSALLAGSLNLPFIPDFRIVGVAFLFSAGVGVAFGYLPARRAAGLDPIAALRLD